MMQPGSIVADRVSVVKDKVKILNDVSFEVLGGTIVGLVGPSGSGKTTLMRAIVGVLAVTSGRLTADNLPAGDKSLRRRIGYMSQNPSVYGDLTVRQNLRYFATILGESKEAVDEVIGVVRLDDQADQLTEKLSGGQKARVSLAVALLGNPKILVLDEPTVGLDPVLREELWSLFADLANKKAKTLLISSHVMDEAERCDNLLLMRDGQLLWGGPRRQLLEVTDTSSVQQAFIAKVSEGDK